ncbi:GrpB family protein [Lysobacter enzymogenes]|uniref:GrpB family protein n=1 Tax=Lysobacter enzymogenes TaxID=69 RepID=UPI001AF9FB45|nr:GrpB family protein [Lysobacter enzymogenes]QQQ02179.1 GrpB family protein [Lysobacter enzymogenes]
MNASTGDLSGALQVARVLRRLREQVQPGELGAESVEQFVRRYSRVRAPTLDLNLRSGCDPAWPQAFDEEKQRLLAALAGEDVAGIEHIGSTSIPQLASKDILDIVVAMREPAAIERAAATLAGLGYRAHGESPIDAGFSWHWRIGPDGGRSFVVHTCVADNPRFAEVRNFRDFLRAFPHERQRYVELKRELAAVPGQTWLEYSALKKILVVRITARANAWRSAGGGV